MFKALDSHSSSGTGLSLSEIGQLFGKNVIELFDDYGSLRKFSELHEVLLGVDGQNRTLEAFLARLVEIGRVSDVVDKVDSCGRTALAWAVEFGWSDAVTTLLNCGANPHQVRGSVHGSLPLLHLAIAGPVSTTQFVKVVKILLQAGVDINAKDHEGWTPLHIAASWSWYDITAELASFGGPALDWSALTITGESVYDLPADKNFKESFLNSLFRTTFQ